MSSHQLLCPFGGCISFFHKDPLTVLILPYGLILFVFTFTCHIISVSNDPNISSSVILRNSFTISFICLRSMLLSKWAITSTVHPLPAKDMAVFGDVQSPLIIQLHMDKAFCHLLSGFKSLTFDILSLQLN